MAGGVLTFLSTVILGVLPLRLSDIAYACKWIVSYLIFRIYTSRVKGRLDFYDLKVKGQPDRVGFLPHKKEEELESPHSESHLARADDGIFFYGVNSAGDFLTVSVNRLCDQKAESTVYIRLASGKVYELIKKSDFQLSSADKNAFTCGGLQAYYLSPMKRWRIFYSGYLKETPDETRGTHRMVYVKFSFLWRASSDVYDNTSDLRKENIVKSVAKANWENILPPTQKLLKVLDFYAQAGVIMGTITTEDDQECYELYLFGERIRCLGDITLTKEIEFSHTLGFVHENGMHLHIGQASANNIMKDLNYGFVVKPSGSLKPMKRTDVSLRADLNSEAVQEMKGSIEADRCYMFCGSVMRPSLSISTNEKSVTFHQINFFVDGKKGTGIHIRGKYCLSAPREKCDALPPVILPECAHPMVVAFTEDLCQLPEFTGGKGSSLGMLTNLSGDLCTFTVPDGVVVTTASYKRFLNADILNEIKILEDVLYGNKEGDAKEASKRVCEKIIATQLPHSVIDNIVKNLNKVFGDEYNSVRFAIRSSATGEDTEQMSAAGQMDTFLGITGLKNILDAVKKCWASQFGFVALQYKRRYGQCLNSPMAVVIQEMIACDVAGVIFTCDPVSGNASKMSIAANFGLGESVVSASVEPDTIELSRDENDELSIRSITTGQKSSKIVLTDGGTTLEDNPESERKECCLSNENIFRLGNLAIKIEKHYRSKRDIEWGFKNGNLFLFQSRPVTSGTQETDFEIEHEFDAALRVENDYFTVSNSGEILPGAVTPLTREVLYKQFAIVFKSGREMEMQSGVTARYFDMFFFTISSHSMLSIPDLFHSSNPEKTSNYERAMMVSFFGRIVDNKEMLQVAYDRHFEERKVSVWRGGLGRVKTLLTAGKLLKYMQTHHADFQVPVQNYTTSKDLFNALMQCCSDNHPAWVIHGICSEGSSLWNLLILSVLSQGKKDINTDVYTDFAKLITTKGGVESADVPAALEDLAHHITKSIKPEDFSSMSTEEALQWLNETSSSAGKKFSQFLTKHGHRCVKEFDMYSTTWESDPKPLVQLLQRLAGTISSKPTEKASTSVFNQIRQLKTPLGLISKLKLLLLVPMSQKAVQRREASKSLLVRHLNGWRKALWEIARRMVSEGRIPDEKILFFMTLEDIKELLDTRSPKVLAKAYHRQKLYPKLNDYIFPEIIRGIPKPINYNIEETSSSDGDISMQGIPVSQGVAKGYVRVAVTLDEAADLKAGEILLAYSTDVGWSPYFPTLAGVATELGGLISHGAVVSREYGLPCVAGLHGATRKFQTGDYVLLDGNTGILKKIAPPT